MKANILASFCPVLLTDPGCSLFKGVLISLPEGGGIADTQDFTVRHLYSFGLRLSRYLASPQSCPYLKAQVPGPTASPVPKAFLLP